MTTLGTLMAVTLAFGLVGIHALLIEGQFRLAHIQHQVDAQQAQYVGLRLQVAELESPQRIVAEAQEQLGMVMPASVTYLTPTASIAQVASTQTPPTRLPASASTSRWGGGWAAAKSALASQP